jgi:hypothetical protein
MHKHSIGACGVGNSIDPRAFIAAQLDLVLNGLRAPVASAKRAPRKAVSRKAKRA